MPEILSLPATAAPASAQHVYGGPSGSVPGFAAVESVARVDAFGARFSHRRVTPPDRQADEEARTTPPSTRGRGEERIGRFGNDESYGRPSSPFLAQYIGQALVSDGGTTGYGSVGQIAYRAAAEQGIAILGIQTPVDFFI